MEPETRPVFIIAEVGSVHDGSFGNALKLIEVASSCGADAVKFQTHISEAETLPDAPMPPYFKGEPRFEYFKRTGFTPEQWRQLKEHCDLYQITFLSSPFSEEAVDLLEGLDMAGYKIPSGEVTNLPMLSKIARTQKPVYLSSGMSSWDELDQAVAEIRKYNRRITVMQCTSSYPCPYEQVGLNVMVEMAARYHTEVGLSDHTLTNYASFAAVVLGARVIEKHLTFSRRMYGSDARHSVEPDEFKDLVDGIRAIEVMMQANIHKNQVEPFQEMKDIFQKSLVAARDLPKGTLLTREHVGIKKPGTGISAARLDAYLGRILVRDVQAGSLFSDDDFMEMA